MLSLTCSNLIILSIHLFLITATIYMIKTSDLKEFYDCLYYQIGIVIVCCKMINLAYNRKKINKLAESLLTSYFEPKNSVEFKIRDKFDFVIW